MSNHSFNHEIIEEVEILIKYENYIIKENELATRITQLEKLN